MNYLLDTCVLSEGMRPRPNPGVAAWLADRDNHSLYISALTAGEIRKGVEKAPNEKRMVLDAWFGEVIAYFDRRIIPVDTAVAQTWGAIQARSERAGRTLPTVDGLLAATALTHGMTLVTRNIGDFRASGVAIENPWT